MKACQHHAMTEKSWYKKPLYSVFVVTCLLLIASFIFSFLQPFQQAFFHFWHTIWWAVILGLVIAGIIDATIPSQYISHVLAKPGKGSILNAVVLGFFMSACSHGILAIAIQLYKKGASVASVITFLLASPWANIAVTIMLIAFFGWKAACFILGAMVIAVITGFAYQWLDKHNLIEKNSQTVEYDNTFSIKQDIKKRWSAFQWTKANVKALGKATAKGTWGSAHMVLWWIIIGTVIGSALEGYVPEHLFQSYLGPSWLGLLTTLALATILEVCSEGSAPIAFSIYKQTQAFGNAFIFLMAGVITDFTEIGLIWSNIGKRAALWLPVISVPQALVLAYLFNHFL